MTIACNSVRKPDRENGIVERVSILFCTIAMTNYRVKAFPHFRFSVVHMVSGLVAATFAISAFADTPKLAPGRWEINVLTDGKTMAQRMSKDGKIPRAVLKRLQSEGVQITESGLIRYCMSEETASRGWQPQVAAAGCRYDVKWNGPQGQFQTICNGKQQSSGDIKIASDKGWSSTSRAKPEQGGRTVVQSTKAKWLGADCQGLKPK